MESINFINTLRLHRRAQDLPFFGTGEKVALLKQWQIARLQSNTVAGITASVLRKISVRGQGI